MRFLFLFALASLTCGCGDEQLQSTLSEQPLDLTAAIAPGVTLPGMWKNPAPTDGLLNILTLNTDGTYTAQYFTRTCVPQRCNPVWNGTWTLAKAIGDPAYVISLNITGGLLERYSFNYKSEEIQAILDGNGTHVDLVKQ